MNDLSPTSATTDPTPGRPAAGAAGLLVIGTRGVPAKEQLVLRSLIRLLDGREGLRLQHAEALDGCNVVFVGGDAAMRLPGARVTIHLVGSDGAPAAAPGLAVGAPLRMTNVLGVLHLAHQQLFEPPVAAGAGGDGLAALFRSVSHHLLARERRVTVLPLLDGRQLTIDFAAERLHSPMPTDELLAGHYRLGAARRAAPAERELTAGVTATTLRDLMWMAAQRLADRAAEPPALHGSFRLRRWPEAAALARLGMPRLCAHLTSRTLDVHQAAAAAGLTTASVQWFLNAALALGVAVPAGEAPEPADRHEPAARAAVEPRSLLSRLRERLKLW